MLSNVERRYSSNTGYGPESGTSLPCSHNCVTINIIITNLYCLVFTLRPPSSVNMLIIYVPKLLLYRTV